MVSIIIEEISFSSNGIVLTPLLLLYHKNQSSKQSTKKFFSFLFFIQYIDGNLVNCIYILAWVLFGVFVSQVKMFYAIMMKGCRNNLVFSSHVVIICLYFPHNVKLWCNASPPPFSHTFCDIVQDKPHSRALPAMWLVLLWIGWKRGGEPFLFGFELFLVNGVLSLVAFVWMPKPRN